MTTTSTPASASWMGTVGPRWLSDVLGAAGVVDGAVAGVETEPLDVAGAAGQLARLSLTYEPAGAAGPATIIAKAPGSSEIQRAMDAAMGLFARERFVYGELAGALPLRLPRCYHPGDGDKEEPMLLEDLRGLRMGDQVAGLHRADAERLVDGLADLHAAFWEADPPGGDASRLVSWTDPMFGAIITQLVTSGVEALRQGYEGRVAPGVLDAIEEVAPDWTTVLRRCAEGPQTFVHNDFRLDNIFFGPDGEPVVIDWQLAGRCRGTQDLAYLLSGSMATDALREGWDLLVRRYHARLLAGGVGGYDLEECRFHYRQSLLYTVAPGIAMLGQMQLGGGDARGLADTLILRTLTHAAELDAFATL
ncbi:MAG TPA: phosphotransferase [Acidimicrobiia bacterium]|nr:phosphotransferase [Acidimicrobiia bacterium]